MSLQSQSEPIHILLVEDNPGDVRLVQEAFAAAEYETTFDVVTDGDEALSVLAESEAPGSPSLPDIVLLDLNLPRTDGFAVLEEIANDSRLSSLPVLVLTSSLAEEDIARSYELTANAYLSKPDSHEEFVSLVRAVEDFWFETARLPSAPS